jgi:hypothetical protein
MRVCVLVFAAWLLPAAGLAASSAPGPPFRVPPTPRVPAGRGAHPLEGVLPLPRRGPPDAVPAPATGALLLLGLAGLLHAGRPR